MKGKPSSRVFAPPRERINCCDKCETCESANKPNQCLTKIVVYEIMCALYTAERYILAKPVEQLDHESKRILRMTNKLHPPPEIS